jgi:large subunit ribosomal protein L25
MQQTRLEAQLRESRGKGAARAARRAGLIPAIVYGHNVAPAAIQLPKPSLHSLLGSGGENVIINMDLGKDESATVMIKEVQIDPVTREILHADFMRVSLEERVTTHVPVSLIGTAPGVSAGGVQEFLLREIQVECQVGKIPEHIEIDVSSLQIGDQIRVRDIEPQEGMAISDDLTTIIVTIVTPTVREAEIEEEAVVEEEKEKEPEVIGETRAEEEEK